MEEPTAMEIRNSSCSTFHTIISLNKARQEIRFNGSLYLRLLHYQCRIVRWPCGTRINARFERARIRQWERFQQQANWTRKFWYLSQNFQTKLTKIKKGKSNEIGKYGTTTPASNRNWKEPVRNLFRVLTRKKVSYHQLDINFFLLLQK